MYMGLEEKSSGPLIPQPHLDGDAWNYFSEARTHQDWLRLSFHGVDLGNWKGHDDIFENKLS